MTRKAGPARRAKPTRPMKAVTSVKAVKTVRTLSASGTAKPAPKARRRPVAAHPAATDTAGPLAAPAPPEAPEGPDPQPNVAARPTDTAQPAGPVRQPSPVRQEPTPDLAAHGKAARGRVRRRELGQWEPPPDRADPVAILRAQEADRVATLLPIRYQRMSVSPFAFYRGAAAIMAADLGSRDHTNLIVQLCGDAHLANFGGYATPDRQLIFDLNDFDETLPGPFEWDIARLVASFQIAGEHRNFSARRIRRLIELVATTYVAAMADLAGRTRMEVWYTRLNAHDVMDRWGKDASPRALAQFRKLLDKGQQKSTRGAVSRYTRIASDGSLHLTSQPPLVVPIAELPLGSRVGDIPTWLANGLEGYRQSLAPDRDKLVSGYRLVDGARKVVGVGSVGTRCWIGLLTAIHDEGDDLVLQVKQAGPSVYESVLPPSIYPNSGQRVVAGQRLVQAASDVLLGWTRIGEADSPEYDFYVRQMWDWKTSADLDNMSEDAFGIYAQMCGWTLARAHARSGPRKAIAAYLGSGAAFTRAMIEFAGSYSEQNQRDHAALLAAIKSGRVVAAETAGASQPVDL